MKRSTFMLISSIYGLLLGAILVISPSEAMKTYGYTSLDFLHNDLSIHLGLLVLIIAAYLLIKRNSENQELVNTILWMNFIATITGALYDIYALKHITEMPTLGYFDIGLRLVIGITTAFYLKKP
ncbi:hypothetical protein [Emticicia sp. SJ17W-69]|uniref:hypothetical protein n=1 Tax=Emticicia sp. SJ17W-69 TaxID=3421657 RepID=UPI003EBAE9DF